MGKGRNAERGQEPRELVAVVDEPAGTRADPQRLVWGSDKWEPEEGTPGAEEQEEETVRFSLTPLHIGVGLAMVAVGLVVPVAAAGITWWAFRRGSS